MSSATVATGLWNNHSYNGAYARTWTLDVSSGALVIAALAVVVSIVRDAAWSIAAYTIHQWRATNNPACSLYHQHQIIYRNQDSPIGAAKWFFRLPWSYSEHRWDETIETWRAGRRKSVYRLPRLFLKNLARGILRTFSVRWNFKSLHEWSVRPSTRRWMASVSHLIFALLWVAGFAVAAIFSSRVAAPGYAASDTRLESKNCGYITWAAGFNGQVAFRAHTLKALTRAQNYARNCYNNSARTECTTYTKQALTYSKYYNVTCPFKGAGRCKDAAFEMSTPWLNSHTDFGINAPLQDRIDIRKFRTCSVLDVANETTEEKDLTGDPVTNYYLGPSGMNANFTAYIYRRRRLDPVAYMLTSVYAFAGQVNDWMPLPDLRRDDGDVTLVFVSAHNVNYPTPVDDPLFAANDQTSSSGRTVYKADNTAGVVGCVDQIQLRGSSTEESTPITSYTGVLQEADKLNLNAMQNATATRFLVGGTVTITYTSVFGLNERALRAQDATFDVRSSGLPGNQWQIEASGWFETSLAMLQDQVVEYASKDGEGIYPFGKLNLIKGRGTEETSMCWQQKVRNVGGYQSFSILGISIIIGVGIFVIVISWFLQSLVDATRSEAQQTKRLLWIVDSVLQQNRLAFQGAGYISWSKGTGAVPVYSGDIYWPNMMGNMPGFQPPHPTPLSNGVGGNAPGHSTQQEPLSELANAASSVDDDVGIPGSSGQNEQSEQ